MGRSTFYSHYRDKEHLLVSGFDDIRAALPGTGHAVPESRPSRPDLLGPALALFEHVGRYRLTWNRLVRKGGANVMMRILQDSAQTLLREHLQQRFANQTDQTEIEATTQFLPFGLMGLLTWWLDSEAPYSAEEVHAMFTRLAAPGVKRFLSAS